MRTYLHSLVPTLAAFVSLPLHPSADVKIFLSEKIKLSADQIATIQNGNAFAKILPSSEKSDIFVFGAVYIHASPTAYIVMMSDMDRLKKMPGYLGAGKFSEPPRRTDLKGFSLDAQDIKDLKNCKPDECDLQLPAEPIRNARNSIDWSGPDLVRQVNDRAEQGLIRVLEAYEKDGDSALGTYLDKPDPVPVEQQFQALMSKVEFFPQYLPELNRYLLEYPRSRPGATYDYFYWEKVNFGLKPTIRLNHAVVYRSERPEQKAYVLAIKQLYATHYFQTAIDLSFCVQDADGAENDGFYLITLKASRQAGLTGFKGGIIRRTAVRKTRSAMEKALNNIKDTLQQPLAPPVEH